MKPYEARHLIAEFPDLTWEEIIEIHEGRSKARIAEQRQKQEEARKMARGITSERHSFGLMSGARLYINKFAPYDFWYENVNGTHYGTEQEAVKNNPQLNPEVWYTSNVTWKRQAEHQAACVQRLHNKLTALQAAARTLLDEWDLDHLFAEKPAAQRSEWKAFADKVLALNTEVNTL